MIDQFSQLNRNRYQVIREEKEKKGLKVIGWVCNYIPEEVILAAGLYPVRILGGKAETTKADAYLYSNICSFVRSCLEEAFQGNYDFLDGIITASNCDHTRRLYDVWYRYINPPFKYQLGLPHKTTEDSIEYYKDELSRLIEGLEDFTGKKISPRALEEAIALSNKTRDLLKQLYSLRKSPNPPITGSETLEVVLSGMFLPKERYQAMLAELLKYLATRKGQGDGQVRLMITGSLLDNPEYIKVIEDLGALVVVDSLCIGSRYFWQQIGPVGDDPLLAIARYYLTRPPCPRMRPYDMRAESLKNLAEEFSVQGIISEMIKFCDNAGEEYPLLKDVMEQIDIPCLTLEREYLLSGLGQMKTRIQAFLESIGG
jgi:bzd-type benzoyl-CoA reductase N subunit